MMILLCSSTKCLVFNIPFTSCAVALLAVAVSIKGNGLLLVDRLKDRALTDVAGLGIALGVVPAPFFTFNER